MTEVEKQNEEVQNKELTSILADPEHFNVKHKLNSSWTIYYDIPQQKKSTAQTWQQNIKVIATFNTIEDFWGVFNSIPPVSKIAPASSYFLFREGIKPEWEDKQNEEGGRWAVTLTRMGSKIDEYWMNLVLACIGESFEYPEQVNGAVASVRVRGDRLALWTRNWKNEEETLNIGKHFKSLIGTEKLSFNSHEDGKQNSKAKERHVL